MLGVGFRVYALDLRGHGAGPLYRQDSIVDNHRERVLYCKPTGPNPPHRLDVLVDQHCAMGFRIPFSI